MEPNTHFCWEKDPAKSWGQTDVEDTVPALSGFMFFVERHSVPLCITLLKRVIINHDTKYQRNRNREPWGSLLPRRQVWEEMS